MSAATSMTTGECGPLENEADRRCRIAEEYREKVRAIADALVAARSERDVQRRATDDAAVAVDQGDFRAARERARAAFEAVRAGARSTAQIAAAGSDWLAEIERIGAAAAVAEMELERALAATEAATAAVEHLVAEAEAARLTAEAAEADCIAARRDAAECAERVRRAAAAEAPAAESPGATQAALAAESPAAPPDEAHAWAAGLAAPPGEPARGSSEQERQAATAGGAALPASEASPAPAPAIRRILSGELAVLGQLADQLAVDEAGRRQWEARLTELLEALLLRAVDAAAVALPRTHPFWGTFTEEQVRDIVAALAALGYRFDGLGGWLDDRVPNQRELSLAVAHAGLDPMRIRHWPAQPEMTELLREAEVLGADYLAAVAPGLTVDELAAVLGRDAASLSDLWADWDRIRPLLLATS